MAEIKILSPHLVNKIAAGEVIERPASVLKELIENALDAGAGRIDVVVEKGGKQLIAVTDDGAGMGPDDLSRAFVSHATSKITRDDDLFCITTMGFRGEALASIAAVSHAHIRTRRRGDEQGHEIEVAGGRMGEPRPCAAPPGTTVTVGDLFFNTPARRKFMRADSTELGHISEAVTRTALAHRSVAFTLTHNGREVLDLPAADTLTQRAAGLLGRDLVDQLLPVGQGGDVEVSGLIGPPSAARPTTRWQYFFLNGRYIRDRLVTHALKEAYRGLIDPQRHPVALVFLVVPPEAVDVNVHPTKVEVRFRDGQSVHSHVLAALRQTLQQAELRPAVRLAEGETVDPGEPVDDPRRQGLREALAEFFRSQGQPASQHRLQFPAQHDRPERHQPSATPPTGGACGASSEHHRWSRDSSLSKPETFSPPIPTDAGGAHEPVAGQPAPPTGPEARDAMQVHDTYLVAADADGIVIVDQHALHERILYDQLVRRIADGPLESQRLLLPVTLSVTPAQRGLLEEHHRLLARLGVETSDFGPDSVAVQRFPSLLDRLDPALFLADALDQLGEGDPGIGQERLIHGLLEMMACKAAVKAGDPLTPQEITELLSRGVDLAKSTACPHGRPTQIRLTLRDLERQFKRT